MHSIVPHQRVVAEKSDSWGRRQIHRQASPVLRATRCWCDFETPAANPILRHPKVARDPALLAASLMLTFKNDVGFRDRFSVCWPGAPLADIVLRFLVTAIFHRSLVADARQIRLALCSTSSLLGASLCVLCEAPSRLYFVTRGPSLAHTKSADDTF
jgi:hypothetical protein